MIGFRPLLALAAVFAASLLSASAQVAVEISLPTNSFVAGEEVPLTVTLTNHSGQTLAFEGNTRQSWIDFNVMSGNQPVSPIGDTIFGKMKLGVGQSLSRKVSLTSIYNLQTMGNFSVYAAVRLPGQTNDGALSNRVTFNIYTPRPYWTQKFGLPDGRQREFRVMNYSAGQKTMLYSQVVDQRTGGIIQTQSLGEALMTRKPSIAIDNKQVMHVLYQINPSVWGHALIAPDGKLIVRDLEKPAGGEPQLVTLSTGSVEMHGGVKYDPKAEAEAQSKVRKATDRPAFLYQ